MAVVLREGYATSAQVESYPIFGERVPALRSFHLAFDHGDASPRDHKIARVAVMVGGDAEDLSPGPGFPASAIPDGQLRVALQDASGSDEFYYKVSHSILPPPNVLRRYRIRRTGNAGEVVVKLPAKIFRVGHIPQPHVQPPILALVGFQLSYSVNREHELDRVGIWFRDDDLHVVFRDQSVGPTDTYSFLVDFVVIRPGPAMNVSRGIKQGIATGGEEVSFPTPSHAHFLLTGWAFNFQSGDHPIREIGIDRTRDDFEVFYSDKNAGDPFDWRVEWAHVGPMVVKPPNGVPAVFDTNYVTDANPALLNPERGMYFGRQPDSDDDHTIVPKWLWLAPVCNVNLTWNGLNQAGTSVVLNAYASDLEVARQQDPVPPALRQRDWGRPQCLHDQRR